MVLVVGTVSMTVVMLVLMAVSVSKTAVVAVGVVVSGVGYLKVAR